MAPKKGAQRERDDTRAQPIERLLLDECNHRIANEVAAAVAAMRLASASRNGRSRDDLIEMAIDRLDGFGECARLLAATSRARVDAGDLVIGIGRAMSRGRSTSAPSRILLDVPPTQMDGDAALRIGMIAHELVTNALKHALPGGGRELRVTLRRSGGSVVLSVVDDGPGVAPAPLAAPRRGSLGGRIVGELVQASNGGIETVSGPCGTAVHVVLPIA